MAMPQQPYWWTKLDTDFLKNKAAFTHEELVQLIHLRELWGDNKDTEDVTLLRRLGFVRWLVEHGKITDDDYRAPGEHKLLTTVKN